jgi:hypothetical protein
MELEDFILREISQTQTEKRCTPYLPVESKNKEVNSGFGVRKTCELTLTTDKLVTSTYLAWSWFPYL